MRLNITPVTLNILIINVLVFVVQIVLGETTIGGQPLGSFFEVYPWGDLFGLRGDIVPAAGGRTMFINTFGGMLDRYPADMFHPVQIVTGMFAHGGVWHLVMNGLGLFFMGTFLEKIVGAKRFLAFYLFCGVLGNILSVLLNPSVAPVLGASGAIFGILVYVAILHPNMPVQVMFIANMRIRVLVIGAAVISVVLLALRFLSGGAIDPISGISHFGHLMGMAAALLYIYALAPIRKKLDL